MVCSIWSGARTRGIAPWLTAAKICQMTCSNGVQHTMLRRTYSVAQFRRKEDEHPFSCGAVTKDTAHTRIVTHSD